MATARVSHAMAVLDGRLYTVGGINNNGGHTSYLSSVERYDPAANAWEAVAPIVTTRCNFAMAVLGTLHAVGGYDGDYFSSVERYDPALDAWEAVAPMAVRRIAFGVAVLDGKLYAVGGSDDDSAERYDPATNAWEAVASMTAAREASRRGGAGRQAVRCWGRDLMGRRRQRGGRRGGPPAQHVRAI